MSFLHPPPQDLCGYWGFEIISMAMTPPPPLENDTHKIIVLFLHITIILAHVAIVDIASQVTARVQETVNCLF